MTRRHPLSRQKCSFRLAFAVFAPLLILFHTVGLLDRLFERSFDREFEWPPYVDVREYVVNRLLHNSTISSTFLSENDWQTNRALLTPNCNFSKPLPKNILLIVVKSSPDRAKHRQVIRSTWGSSQFTHYGGFSVRTVFVMGSKSNSEEALQAENRDFGDLLVGSFEDTYRNNTMKFILSIGFANNYCNNAAKQKISHVFLVDDDYLVSIPNLIAESKKYAPHERLYMGWRFDSSPFRFVFHKHRVSLSNYPFDRYPPYISAGAVLLTHQTIREFYYAIEHVRVYPYDDVYAGIIAYLLGIYVRHNEHFQFWGSLTPMSEMGAQIAIHGYSPEHIAEMFSS